MTTQDDVWTEDEAYSELYWEELRKEVAARGVQYPRSDPLHPEYGSWLAGKLPALGDAPEAPVKPVQRKRDVSLGSESKASRSRDRKLPTRRQSKP